MDDETLAEMMLNADGDPDTVRTLFAFKDILHDMCVDNKDATSAYSMAVQEMLEGQDVGVGIGLAIQLALNGCKQLADANNDNADDVYKDFCLLVSALTMNMQFTANSNTAEKVFKQ